MTGAKTPSYPASHPHNKRGQPLWTANAVAAFLGIDVKTVEAWARKGRIPSAVDGRRRWFDPADSDQWVAGREGQFTKTCVVCGNAFRSNRPEARCCSYRCSQRAYRARRDARDPGWRRSLEQKRWADN